MDAGHIASDASKYPLSNFNRILILGILTILSSLIIPGFLVLGYLFKILKSTMEGSSELPIFDEWIQMFVDGLKVFVVLFIYSLVPLILIFLGIWAALLPMLSVPGYGSILNPTISMGFISGITFVGIGLQIVVSFFIPIALGNMAQHNKLGSAFRFGEIIEKIREIGGVDYFIWFVVMVIIAWAAYFISFFLIFPLLIGVIIVPLLVLPYLMMFFARSVALIYAYGEEYEYAKSAV